MGGFVRPGTEDESLSNPQLESREDSVRPALSPSMQQRNHRDISCPRGKGSSFYRIENSPKGQI